MFRQLFACSALLCATATSFAEQTPAQQALEAWARVLAAYQGVGRLRGYSRARRFSRAGQRLFGLGPIHRIYRRAFPHGNAATVPG